MNLWLWTSLFQLLLEFSKDTVNFLYKLFKVYSIILIVYLYKESTFQMSSFLSLLSELDTEGYMPLNMNMKNEVMHLFLCMISSLVIFLLHDTVWTHVIRMRLQKLTNLRCNNFPHWLYSPDISLTKTTFFLKQLDTFFFTQERFRPKTEVVTAFEEFLVSKPLEFYCIAINNLVNRWQKCTDIQRWYLNSGIKVYSKIKHYLPNNLNSIKE